MSGCPSILGCLHWSVRSYYAGVLYEILRVNNSGCTETYDRHTSRKFCLARNAGEVVVPVLLLYSCAYNQSPSLLTGIINRTGENDEED